MNVKAFPKIEESELKARSVSKLADRPNLVGQYGTSGLTAKQLKEWFDNLSMYLAERINSLFETFSTEDAAKYIRVKLDHLGVYDLEDLATAISNGSFAREILILHPNAGTTQLKTLQTIVNDIAQKISEIEEKGVGGGGGSNIVVEDTVTPDGTNPVSSKAIYDFVADLLYEAIQITSFSVEGGNNFEVSNGSFSSSTKAIKLKWSLSKGNDEVVSQSIDGVGAIDKSSREYTYNLPVTAIGNPTITLRVTDKKGNTTSRNLIVSVCNRIYYGVAERPSNYNADFVKTLTSVLSNAKGRTINGNAGENQYIYYCVPKRLGECAFSVDGWQGGFSKVTGNDGIQITNGNKYYEYYDIYESEQSNLGNTTVVIS